METQKRPELFTSLWNSSFVRVLLYAVLCQFTMSISNTVLPLYVVNGLGMSTAESGLLGTMFTIGSVCCRFFAGYISDRFGRRLTLVLGAGIVAVALFALGFQTTLIMLLVFKVVQGVGHALNSTASNAVASEVLPRERMGQGIGYFSLHSTFTNAIGPTVTLALMGVAASGAGAQDNYLLPMLVGGGMGAAALLLGASLGYEKKLREIDPAAVRRPRGIRLTDFIERRALMPALMMFFTAFSSGAGVYMIIFAKEPAYGISDLAIAVYYILNAGVALGLRFLLGKKLDAVRPRTVALAAIVLNVVSYALLGLTLSQWAFLLSAVLMGAYQSMLTPTFNAMALKLAPESRSGAASATYWLGFDGGMAVGMLAFGVVIEWGSYPAAFLGAAAYMAVFGVAAFFLLYRVKPIREIESPTE